MTDRTQNYFQPYSQELFLRIFFSIKSKFLLQSPKYFFNMVEITEFIEIDKVTDIDVLLNGPPAYEDVVNQTLEKTR